MSDFYSEYDGWTAPQLGQELQTLAMELEELEDQVKEIKGKMNHIKVHRLPEIMDAEGLKNFRLASGKGITVVNEFFVNVLAENKPSILEWLRDTGNESLIKEDVHPSTFKSFIKGKLEAGEEYPADMVNVTIVPTARFLGAR